MRISDWSSDVCSSDLRDPGGAAACVEPVLQAGCRRRRHRLWLAQLRRRNACLELREPVARRLSAAIDGVLRDGRAVAPRKSRGCADRARTGALPGSPIICQAMKLFSGSELGIAPCRERVCEYV